MGNTVSSFSTVATPGLAAHTTVASLYTSRGARKYLSRSERQRVIALTMRRQRDADLFALTLAWTGGRLSEVLALTPEAFDLETGLVTLQTLKRRRPSSRQLPLPAELLALLAKRYLSTTEVPTGRIWRFSRATAWRHVKGVMRDVGLSGHAASPRGLRHGFAVASVMAGVPVTLLQRWLGHARLTTTAIYMQVSGPEEMGFAKALWAWSSRPVA